MAIKPLRKMVVSNGEYTDRDGNVKKRWQRIGTLFKDDETGDISFKLDVIPVGPEWSGWGKGFKLDDEQQPAASARHEPTTTRNVYDQQNQKSDNPAAAADFEGEDIPF